MKGRTRNTTPLITQAHKLQRSGPLVAMLVVVVAAPTCIVVGPHPEINQPCDAQNGDGNWASFDFSATVELPDECPLRIDEPGHSFILDGTLEYPDDDLEPFDHATVQILNRENDEKAFSQVLPQHDIGQGVWVADYIKVWNAGTGNPNVGRDRDTVVFDHTVDVTGGSPTAVSGGVDLPYSEIPDVDANGPASASPISIVEIDASVLNGKMPMTYVWYDNGVKVDSATVSSHVNTLTVFGLSSGTHVFEVRAKDADGDQASTTHSVEVS